MLLIKSTKMKEILNSTQVNTLKIAGVLSSHHKDSFIKHWPWGTPIKSMKCV